MAGSILRSKMRSLRIGKAEESKGEEKPWFVLSFCSAHNQLCKYEIGNRVRCAPYAMRSYLTPVLFRPHGLRQDSRQTAHRAVSPSVIVSRCHLPPNRRRQKSAVSGLTSDPCRCGTAPSSYESNPADWAFPARPRDASTRPPSAHCGRA